ncbi:hypothetical protein VSS74_03935 [Conexibacter stalactiti]|uniref:Secreted protein n=1 Tax=Conexibacter stalactiti TaxID=1940611 RepID=A0ABU4HJI3_9ACTN|nr:hypothetical protein [Conexibacter stalactiti]MDW5593473.1 hypothetical protein [Conexibacter stalactiti]MEC5034114.1 hypothetical protein [Conexibacter stalactiti]
MKLVPACRALIATMALTLVVAGAQSSTASAYRYCSGPVPATSACGNTAIGDYIANDVIYAGTWTGTVRVCEKTTTGGSVQSRVCAMDRAWSSSAWIWSIEQLHAGNDSPWTHTIYGDAVSPSPLARSAGSSTRPDERSLLARGAVDRATLPSEARSEFEVLRRQGARPVATITRPDDQVAVTATDEGVCVRSTGTHSGSCQTPENAANGRLISVSVCAPDRADDTLTFYGLVPDGVTAIEAVTAGGEVLTSAAVSLNTYRLDLPKSSADEAAQLRWVGETGGIAIDEILPTDLTC